MTFVWIDSFLESQNLSATILPQILLIKRSKYSSRRKILLKGIESTININDCFALNYDMD